MEEWTESVHIPYSSYNLVTNAYTVCIIESSIRKCVFVEHACSICCSNRYIIPSIATRHVENGKQAIHKSGLSDAQTENTL